MGCSHEHNETCRSGRHLKLVRGGLSFVCAGVGNACTKQQRPIRPPRARHPPGQSSGHLRHLLPRLMGTTFAGVVVTRPGQSLFAGVIVTHPGCHTRGRCVASRADRNYPSATGTEQYARECLHAVLLALRPGSRPSTPSCGVPAAPPPTSRGMAPRGLFRGNAAPSPLPPAASSARMSH